VKFRPVVRGQICLLWYPIWRSLQVVTAPPRELSELSRHPKNFRLSQGDLGATHQTRMTSSDGIWSPGGPWRAGHTSPCLGLSDQAAEAERLSISGH
jgi:hypothetical protein